MEVSRVKLDSNLTQKIFNGIIKKIIVESLLKYPNIKHVILYGGYGRGEGAWFEEDGEIHPYNDFDLMFVFVDELPESNSLADFRKYLAKIAGVSWIDITFEGLTNLKNKKNSILNYDLKFGSKVIYGNPRLLDILPSFPAKDISLLEGEILFFTRLWAFSGGLPSLSALDGDNSRFFRYQMAKSILAVMDAVLLMNKSYDTSYIRRCELLMENKYSCIRENDYSMFEWALSEKLSPSNIPMDIKEVEKLYLSTSELYRFHMLKLLSEKYGKDFNLISQFSKYYQKNIIIKFKRLIYPLVKQSFIFEKIYYANIVQMNVLSVILNEGETEGVLKSSSNILSKFGYDVSSELCSIKKSVAHMRENI